MSSAEIIPSWGIDMRDGTRLKILARGIQSRKDDWGYLCVSKKWRSKCLCSGHELCSQRERRVFLLFFLKREEQRGKEQAVFGMIENKLSRVSLQICMVLNGYQISSQEPYKQSNVDSVIYVTFKLLCTQISATAAPIEPQMLMWFSPKSPTIWRDLTDGFE